MARPLDCVKKDEQGFVRVGEQEHGVVLFRVISTATGPMVHIRLKRNCWQVEERGDPDYYVPWEEFKAEVERGVN